MSPLSWLTSSDRWLEVWAGSIWRASWQGGLLILGVGLACRLLPRLPASWRCTLWWLVCLRLLLGLVELPPMRLAVLPAPSQSSLQARPASGPAAPEGTPSLQPDRSRGPAPPPGKGLLAPLFGCWLLGALLHAAFAAWKLGSVRRLLRDAEPVASTRVQEELARLASGSRLRRLPPLRTSRAVPGPLLVGLLRPVLLLPTDLLEVARTGELRLALAHEIAHLRRGDLWLGLLPGLAQGLFFFHPLVRLAAQEWALSREAACDAETLQLTEAPPADYGRFLLRLAASAPPAVGALGANPTYRTLERRLKMLNEFRSPVPAGARAAALVLTSALVVTLLPWQVTAQEATPAPREGTRAATPQPKLDPTTGKLQIDRGGARITGKLPAPVRNGAARVSEVSIRGNTAIPVEKLRAVVKTRAGEPFDPARWEQDRQAIARLYQDQGYQVRLESAPPKDGKVLLTLQEVRVGSVALKGLDGDEKERAALLARLKQKAGGLYNSKQLQDDFRTLQETKRFETINPTVEVGEDQKIVITWELQEKKK